MSSNLTISVVDLKGQQVGEVAAPQKIFGIEPNETALHFVCEGQRFRFYKKTACVKTRSAVKGSTKKIRKQKGTGGARQGTVRAPHWVGGGKVFGPSAIIRDFKVNKKMRQLALASVLSDRFSGGQIRILRADMDAPKTSSISNLIKKLSLNDARVGFVLDSEKENAMAKSVRNIKNSDMLGREKWTPLDFVKADSLIISEKAFADLTKSFGA